MEYKINQLIVFMEEIFPLVDSSGNVIGSATRSHCHDGSMLLHPVVHLHIFNSAGDLYLQKRSQTKDIQPGLWDTSSAGHIDLGETPEESVTREVKEELSITELDSPCFITKYIIKTEREVELSYCYYTVYDGEMRVDNEEVSEGRFWKLDEIMSYIGKGIFTVNFESDFNNFLHSGLFNLIAKYNNNPVWLVNSFEELDLTKLYNILALRNKVFTLEQKVECVDIDYKDQQAIHVQGYINGKLAAYCRVFMSSDDKTQASFGRVAVNKDYRGNNLGYSLTKKALTVIGNQPITISAQQYLEQFYGRLGFKTISKPYLEAGIKHVKMQKVSL